jgi:hypothetical protein
MYDLIIISDKFALLPKALLPIVVTEAGIVIDVRFVQPSNALLPIVVIDSGIRIEVRFVQPLNALFSTPVIKLLRITIFKFVLLEKAESGTLPK